MSGKGFKMKVDEYTTTTPKSWLTKMRMITHLRDLDFEVQQQREDLMLQARMMLPAHRLYMARSARQLNRVSLTVQRMLKKFEGDSA